MADRLGKLVVERVEDATALDPKTGKLLWLMDEPTSGSLESAMDTVWAEGKGGRRLYGLDKNKTASFTCKNGYLVTGALQTQVGGSITELDEDHTADVPVVEYVKAANGKLQLQYTPVAGSLKYIYVANADLTQGDSYQIGSDAAKSFSLSGAIVTLPTGADQTATYIAIYDRTAKAGTKITNDSDVYPSTAKVIFTVLCHESCDMNRKIYTKLVFPAAKIDGNFTLDISGDAVVQELKIDAMSSICDVNHRYWDWYVIED